MRFKLYFNEQKQVLDINCLNDSHSDIILPEDPSQHVYFPIPNDLKVEVHEHLIQLIADKDANEFQAITDEIQKLTDRRREMVNELRTQINPKIIEKCKEFREEHAEFFI